MEEIRILTVQELKKEIKENLEYAHPERDTNPAFGGAFGVSYGFKPIVNEIFFDSEEAAVAYTFQTDAKYKMIQECALTARVIEYFDEKNDTLIYECYSTKINLTLTCMIFSPQWNEMVAYDFVISKESFSILYPESQFITCKSLEKDVCVWEGAITIENMLSYDKIIYPENIRQLFEYLWISWKNDKIDNDQVEIELIALTKWLDSMTRTKPLLQF